MTLPAKNVSTIVILYLFIYFIISVGKFIMPYLGKATAAARAARATQSYEYMLGLFVFP